MVISEPERRGSWAFRPGAEIISKQKGSTKILLDSCLVFPKYAKRQQIKEMLMLAGCSYTQFDKPMSTFLET